MTRWLDPHPLNIPASFSALGLHPMVAQTLFRRGIHTPESARAFLHPDEIPPTPFPNIDPAVERITAAIRNGEMICVWGDFDVDGQTSTALLVQTLQVLGANVVHYIPIRGKESHGVHIESLQPIIDNGAKLIVTCDTGIGAYEAVDYANSRGVDVIVTDHHDLGDALPNAKAIINPKLLPSEHALKNLAGVGVAYKLAEALLANYQLPITSADLLDLVALGLIADVALLKGETRTLAQKGIRALRNTNRLGLKAIAELSSTSLESLTEETIGFTFAPRLNALGRLADANPAVELLLTNDPARARVLAAQIEGLNAQRRLLTSQVYEATEALLRAHPEFLTEPAIVLAHPNWPGGVVGIVANKLVDRYHKPAFLLTESEDGILRGSARSVEGLHITEAITANRDLLMSFGGHPMAAGISLLKENLPAFRKGLGRAVENQLGASVREEPTIQIDAWLGLDDINLDLASALETMAPFGAGNPPLVLASRGLTLKSSTEIGRARDHRKLIVEDEQGFIQEILWWNGAGEELPDGKFDLTFSLRANTFRGEKRIQVQFKEFRVLEQRIVEIQPPDIEINDWRSKNGKIDPLPSSVLIWAEGSDKEKGKSRFDLYRSDEFAIYTTPASPADLHKALEIVKPKKIYLLAVAPSQEKTDGFLKRLAGMAKYAINTRGGKVSIKDLAIATAQRESAVRIGLEWLAAGGHLSFSGEGDAFILSEGNGEANQYLQRELFLAIKGILEETTAYREYFQRAPVEGLISRKD